MYGEHKDEIKKSVKEFLEQSLTRDELKAIIGQAFKEAFIEQGISPRDFTWFSSRPVKSNRFWWSNRD
ncbi:MAG: hypothetical protein D6732_02890 [Methanobacteriota archaeon]|nr:MAG: hypothetical protein D6732_02890 [Euryarchaeota archaeon]